MHLCIATHIGSSLLDLFTTPQSPSHGGLCQFKITIFAPLQWAHHHIQVLRFPFLYSSCGRSLLSVIWHLLNNKCRCPVVLPPFRSSHSPPSNWPPCPFSIAPAWVLGTALLLLGWLSAASLLYCLLPSELAMAPWPRKPSDSAPMVSSHLPFLFPRQEWCLIGAPPPNWRRPWASLSHTPYHSFFICLPKMSDPW
jgi:hypothetical protein